MNLRRKVTCIITILLLILILSSCSTTSNDTMVFMLFDISGSTGSNIIRERYKESSLLIINELKGGETVIADLITENTLSHASYPIYEVIPKYNIFLNNRATHNEDLEKIKIKLSEKIKNFVINTKSTPQTDLMNAFQLVDKVFNGDNCKVDKKKLIIFSDMVEESRSYNFRHPLNDKRIQSIIQSEKDLDRLPNLNGVDVWVVGAAAEWGDKLSIDQIYQIEKFWITYFKAAGANLSRERYAPNLINFNLE